MRPRRERCLYLERGRDGVFEVVMKVGETERGEKQSGALINESVRCEE